MPLAIQNPMSLTPKALPPNTTSLIQPLDQGAIRTLKAHYTQCSVGRTVNTMRENIMEVCKECTVEQAITVIGKSVKAIKPETIHFCGRKMCQDVHDFAGFTTEPIKGVMKEVVDVAKGVGRTPSTYGSWRK